MEIEKKILEAENPEKNKKDRKYRKDGKDRKYMQTHKME